MNQSTNQSLRIGILGCRGIPNHYGGFEQFAEYLSVALVERGHQVWVYNSSLHPYREKEWKGVRLIHQYDPEHKLGSFGQFVYDFNCLLDARKRNFDLLLQLGYTSSVVFHRLWPSNCHNIIHMDGLEWKRTKYSPLIRRFLLKMERWAATFGDSLIADSIVIQEYLSVRYDQRSKFIPYGAISEFPVDVKFLEEYALKPHQYFLVISRFVPENNLEMIIKGYLESGHSGPLVLVGSLDTSFGRQLKQRYQHASNLLFLGGIFDLAILNSLRHFAKLYFHGHSVGGTNPSLLEAMACRVVIGAHDNPFNRAVLGEEAFYFHSAKDIHLAIREEQWAPAKDQWINTNYKKIQNEYNWEVIVDQYEAHFSSILKDRSASIAASSLKTSGSRRFQTLPQKKL